jgi:hypothetical protein
MPKPDPSPPIADVDIALSQLLSKDGLVLLNVINDLRGLRVDDSVDVPTIVVCGDQSSGKSSVLEAICKLSLPKGDNGCTNFATELAIRREPRSSVSVKIQPYKGRSLEEQHKISGYNALSADLDDFERIINDAKAFLITQGHPGQASYYEDILRVGM